MRENILGVDVAKDTLEVFELHSEEVYSIANDGEAIEQWLGPWEMSIRRPSSRRTDVTQSWLRGLMRAVIRCI